MTSDYEVDLHARYRFIFDNTIKDIKSFDDEAKTKGEKTHGEILADAIENLYPENAPKGTKFIPFIRQKVEQKLAQEALGEL